MDSTSIYIHIPFCRHRCAYCDFNTYANQEARIPEYTDALLLEIQSITASASQRFPVHTVYFGGGTPSLLPPQAVERVLMQIAESFHLSPAAEISLEANPGTLSPDYLKALRSVGVDRLSLGMQSAQPMELAFLERQHHFDDVVKAVDWARAAGFDNLNLDLIFGLPEQPLAAWEGSLDKALDLAPEHFSLYALTIEHGTPLGKWASQGLIPLPDPDRAADMYELASQKLAQAGYFQYEISNWANTNPEKTLNTVQNPQFACRHNLQYWRNQPYFGLGAGAHGFIPHWRTSNVRAPGSYIRRLSRPKLEQPFPRTPATVNMQTLDQAAEMAETMMMGLRLTREGVSRARFQQRFGCPMTQIYGSQIKKWIAWGLLEWAGVESDILRLTSRGYLLGNQVFSEFV